MKEWVAYRVGDICSLVNGAAFKSSEFIEEGVPVIKIANVKPNKILLDDLKCVSKEVAEKKKKSRIYNGDILLTMTGNRMDGSPDSWVGKAAVFREDGHYMLNQRVCIIRPDKEKVNIDFLAYYLSSWDSQVYFINHATSSGGQANISPAVINDYKIFLPDLETQEQIASILRLMDLKIRVNETINNNLQLQLRFMFENMFITNADEGWPIKKLGDFLSLERGLSYKGKFLSEDEGIPMLNLGNILPNSVFREEKVKYYTGEFKARHVVKPGDIIVANTDLTQAREVLGSAIRVPLLDYETIICSHHISIVRHCNISNNFILGLLNMPQYRARVAGFATGTTVLALPNETILNCEFSKPPEELIRQYDNYAEPVYNLMETLRIENKKLNELRNSLLPKLLSGELDVSEVIYE